MTSNPNAKLVAPFPWFGGKSRVADRVWDAFGDVHHYIEPFAGSLAVLLGRPVGHKRMLETVNDIDRFIANFWRAVKRDPEAVALHASDPINECDLTARHRWLVNTGAERIANLDRDPEYYDAQVAGWWVWGISCWIGGRWCRPNNRMPNGRRPSISQRGEGVHRTAFHASGDAPIDTRVRALTEYMLALQARLASVRVCCGDWSRVVQDSIIAPSRTVGIFLDPPYDLKLRDSRCYNADQAGLSDRVRQWCVEHADNPRCRIALCGYEGEHDLPGWRCIAWTTLGGYGNSSHKRGRENKSRERIWFSPNCLDPGLFAVPSISREGDCYDDEFSQVS